MTGPLTTDLLFQVMKGLGIRYMFGTPGTTELPTVAIPKQYEIEYVQALHENVAMGMAMGYARQSGLPGVVSLHVTPGVAHAMGNLYNAWRARLPVVVVAGDHHSQLRVQEPILVSDMVQMARQYTKWSYEVKNTYELPLVLQRAFKEAMTEPQGPVFISLPVDLTLEKTDQHAFPVTKVGTRTCGDMAAIEEAARRLVQARHPLIVAGDGVGLSEAWHELAELAERLHAPVFMESFSSLMNFPNDHPHWLGEIPNGSAAAYRNALTYGKPNVMDPAKETEKVDLIFFVGFSMQAPLTVFPTNAPALLPEGIAKLYLHNDPWEIGKNAYGDVAILGDIKTSLQPLNAAVAKLQGAVKAPADLLRADRIQSRLTAARKGWESFEAHAAQVQEITPVDVAQVLGKFLRGTDFVVVDEAMSNNAPLLNHEYITYPKPKSYYSGRGVSLGYSMGSALGIQMADRGLRVVNVVGDGSAAFYPHAFWSAVKENLPVLFVVLNNREYRTLKLGFAAMRSKDVWHPDRIDSLNLEHPDLDYVKIAGAYGVEGERAETPEAFERALKNAFSQSRPYLIEVPAKHTPDQPYPQGRTLA